MNGDKLHVGDSASVEFMLNTVGSFTAAGIALATNPAENGVDMYVIWHINSSQFWAIDSDDPNYITGIGTQTGISTITVTRVSGSVFDWTVRGGGLTVDNSYTNSNWSDVDGIYFGIMNYRGSSGTAGVFDNLTYHYPPAGAIISIR